MEMVKRAGAAVCALMIVASARADWIEESNRHALRVLEANAEFVPERAAGYGLEGFDAETVDLGPKLHQRQQTSRAEQAVQLQKALQKERDPKVRQDLEILLATVEEQVESARIEHKYFLPYYNLHQFIFQSFNSLLDPRNDSTRYPAALQRLRRYTGVEKGYRPLTELARAASEERYAEKDLLGPYRGELEADLGNTPQYLAALPQLFERAGLEGWEADLEVLEKQLADYRDWLEKDMLPRAREDNLLPREVYADNLKGYGVDVPPQELINQALYSYQLLRGR